MPLDEKPVMEDKAVRDLAQPANMTEADVAERLEEAFASHRLSDKKLLVVIPDNTRSAPIDLFFRSMHESWRGRVKRLDFLVALGTHPIMSEEELCRRVGVGGRERIERYGDTGIFNHRWDLKETFASLGWLGRREIESLSEGKLSERAEVLINRLALEYDRLLIVGPVFPHEIAGYSGSNKYLFPGISELGFTDVTHWVSALETNLKTIGRKDTPARRIIDRAAGLLRVPIVYLNLVVDEGGLKGLFIGEDKGAWETAVELSSRLNVRYAPRPFKRVLSIAPRKYDDFWTGAKAFYKIEPLVEEGGELVVYAPHIREVSVTHGRYIDRVGFHVKDYFLARWEEFRDVPRTVLAYSSLVRGAGCCSGGEEFPRVRLALATGIPKELCERFGFGYIDPRDIVPEEWEGREKEGVKVIRNAGEVLYKVGGRGRGLPL